MNRILVVDDEINMQVVLRAMLKKEGYEVFTAPDGREALKVLADDDIDVVVTDLKMPNMDGMGLLERVAADYPAVPVIMITAHGTVATAVDALKKGAFDYVTKPFEQDELKNVVLKAIKTRRLSDEEFVAGADEIDRYGIVGASEPMQEIFETIKRVAPTTTTILISGETGTGKELIANAIHINSPRKGNPLIKINCAAIAENLMESELFGYEKGAFTGAVSDRRGKFELADGGTIFLDEIGDMSLKTQAKVLRVLQEQVVEPVGGAAGVRVDVRVLAATNKDLEKEMEEGRFRQDLYYRLNVIPLRIPPLRDRKEDIPILVERFIRDFAVKEGDTEKKVADEVLTILMKYHWPGNVRELKNIIERLVIMTPTGVITKCDILPFFEEGKGEVPRDDLQITSDSFRAAKQEFERQYIVRKLREYNGNISRTAEAIGLERSNLHKKIRSYELDVKNGSDKGTEN